MGHNLKPAAQVDVDDEMRRQLSDIAIEKGNGRHVDLDDAVRRWRELHAQAMFQG